MSYKWYVVITSANRENETAKILDKYDLVSYNPQVKVPSNIKNQDIFKPLFPGYLFAHTKYKNMKLPSISQINGIYGWLKFNDDLPYIEDSVISEIKRTLFNINSSYGLWSDFKPGEKVMVEAGKISEYEEIIENALGENEQLSKKDINKMIETDGGHLATALRSLIQKNRIISGSDGSTRVYRLNS